MNNDSIIEVYNSLILCGHLGVFVPAKKLKQYKPSGGILFGKCKF